MPKLLLLLILVAGMFACTPNENHSEADLPSSEISTADLPDEIRSLENLIVLPDSVASHSIEFRESAVFKDSDEQSPDSGVIYIGNMRNMDVDNEGRVYVAPTGLSAEQSIHIFNPDGSYLRKLGRDGRGPGEFVRIANMKVQSGKLYVHDGQLFRYSIFSLDDFESIGQIILSPESWRGISELGKHRVGYEFYPRNDGTILVEFEDPSYFYSILNPQEDLDENIKRYDRFFLVNEDGSVSPKQIFEKEDLVFGNSPVIPFVEGNLPHNRNPIMAVGDDGTIYSAWTGEFLIKVYNPDGQYERAIYFPFDRAALESEEIISKYDHAKMLQDIASDASYPATWPALDKIIVDDEDRLWISTITNSKDEFEWWVIDEEGELLAKFNWPGERLNRGQFRATIKAIRNGYMYYYDLDEGASYADGIVKYEIIFHEK